MSETVDRASGIGGSEIAAIVGLSPYKTPFGVYCDKLGLVEPFEANERMKMGKLLEPVVKQLYENETGANVIWSDQTIRHPKEAIVVGTPDGYVEAPDVADQFGFEAKTAGLDQAWRWGSEKDAIPQEYLAQCTWYMLLTGAKRWDVGVLIGGDTFRVYPLQADEKFQAILLEAAQKFWRNHIEKRNPPAIDASPAAAAYLKRTYPHGVEDVRAATDDERELMAGVMRLRKERRFIEKQLGEVENKLKLSIGNAKGLYDTAAEIRAAWSEVAEGVVETYTRSAYRRLTVKSHKEESDA